MTKQQKTYLLLMAVLIVWGIIGHQMYTRLHPANTTPSTIEVPHTLGNQKLVDTSHYQLHPPYRDPFLGKLAQQNKNIKKRRSTPKVQVPFPNLVYNGLVRSNTAKLYIITLNGQQEIVAIGERIQNIKLVSGNAEMIVIKFGKHTKTILKQL